MSSASLPRHVFVTGGTGSLGPPLAAALVEAVEAPAPDVRVRDVPRIRVAGHIAAAV